MQSVPLPPDLPGAPGRPRSDVRRAFCIAVFLLALGSWGVVGAWSAVSTFLAGSPVNLVTAVLFAGACGLSVGWALLIRLRWGVLVLALAVAAAGVVVVRVNWSLVAPSAYFDLHRSDFAAIADLASTTPAEQSEYYGSPLPSPLDRQSVMGSAGWVGCVVFKPGRGPATVVRKSDFGTVPADQENVWFVPQWTGIPDDAGGYVFVIGEPTDGLACDLYGRLASLADADSLGGGWFWL